MYLFRRQLVTLFPIFTAALAWITPIQADTVTLQLKWRPQAQFAGFYAAKYKGFYRAVGLDVVINPGGPKFSPMRVIRNRKADVVVNWMGESLAARERGLRLLNVAQIFQHSGQMLTCRRDAGIKRPEDFRGRTIGMWFFGNEFPFLSWMAGAGIRTDGGTRGVTLLKQGYTIDPLLSGAAHCISTMSYNEYWKVVDSGISEESLINFRYEDNGVSVLEDGLYVLEDRLKDPAFADRMVRFLRASFKGWTFARTNAAETVDILVTKVGLGEAERLHQKRMLVSVNALIAVEGRPLGYLDPKDFTRTAKVLLSGKSRPVITRPPEGGWTHSLWERATKNPID